jgi:hypothetical protein
LNTENLGNSTSFLTITHTTWSAKRYRKYRILIIDVFNFQTRIGRKSESPEYCFGWQLSPLSDGPINSSKRLVINELWQSETRPVAKTIFLSDQTYLYKTGFLWKFCDYLSRNFAYEKCHQRAHLSAGYSYDSF